MTAWRWPSRCSRRSTGARADRPVDARDRARRREGYACRTLTRSTRSGSPRSTARRWSACTGPGFLRAAFLAAASLGQCRRLIELKNRRPRQQTRAGLNGSPAMTIARKAPVDGVRRRDAVRRADRGAAARDPQGRGARLAAGPRGPESRRRGHRLSRSASTAAGRSSGYTGAPEIGGRFFYDEATDRPELRGRADRARRVPRHGPGQAHLDDAARRRFYIGSTDIDTYLPGLRAENDLGLDHAGFGGEPPLVEHLDRQPHHGRGALRHVEQHRLLRGRPAPLHAVSARPGRTISIPARSSRRPAGRWSAWSTSRAPDLERYPALPRGAGGRPGGRARAGRRALLSRRCGGTRSRRSTPFNVHDQLLVEHRRRPSWTRRRPRCCTRCSACATGPEHEKQAWRALFDYYVFGPAERAGAHLPEQARGDLAPLDETKARRLRAELLNRLNR